MVGFPHLLWLPIKRTCQCSHQVLLSSSPPPRAHIAHIVACASSFLLTLSLTSLARPQANLPWAVSRPVSPSPHTLPRFPNAITTFSCRYRSRFVLGDCRRTSSWPPDCGRWDFQQFDSLLSLQRPHSCRHHISRNRPCF